MSQCTQFGYTPAQAAAEVVRVIGVVDGWREHFAGCGVTEADLDSLAERIDGQLLLGQRRAFDPMVHAAPIGGVRRRNPLSR
jgi:serine/threonine-protein kinase HipA